MAWAEIRKQGKIYDILFGGRNRMKQIFYLQLDSSVTAVPGGLIQEILQRLQHLILDYAKFENSTICLESVQKQSQNNRKCESDTEWLGTG